jgi:hypothetical protein
MSGSSGCPKQCPQSGEYDCQGCGPWPGGGEPQRQLVGASKPSAGGVQQPGTQPLGLGQSQLAVKQQALQSAG